MLDTELENYLNRVFKRARHARHEFITVEHLLLGIIKDQGVSSVLAGVGCDLVVLEKELKVYIDTTTPLVSEGKDDYEPQPTTGFQRCLQRAVFHVQSKGDNFVSATHVLVAVYSEKDSIANSALLSQGANREDVVNFLSDEGCGDSLTLAKEELFGRRRSVG